MLTTAGSIIGGGIGFIVLLVAIVFLEYNAFFVVKQQHAVIIERLGKFNKIVGAGLTSRFRSSTAKRLR